MRVSHMDRSRISTKHSQRLLVSPKVIGYSHSYFLSGFFPYYACVSSLHPQKCPTWIPTVLPKNHTHTSIFFYSPSFTRKEGRGSSSRSLHEKAPRNNLYWESWRLCRSFINLTEWCQRRVMCQQLIGYINTREKIQYFSRVLLLFFLGREIPV